jgi:outer membrane murein-binding lipoprotein Lpp
MKMINTALALVTALGLCAGCSNARAQDDASGGTPAYAAASGMSNNGTIAALQAQVQGLTSRVNRLEQSNQSAQPSAYSLSVEPAPNYDNAPIPNGDYPLGWTN